MRRALALLIAFALSACARQETDGAVDVAYLAGEDGLFADGLRIGPGAQLVRAARWQGLVRLDERGEVVPGVAERWIVTDDGLSYIFRLRPPGIEDERELSAQALARTLGRAIRALDGTSLGLDLAPVRDVRAMTGRVIEIRLDTPFPGLLQLLAQPELALAGASDGGALMTFVREGDAAILTPLPPEARGLPSQGDWAELVQPVSIRSAPPGAALEGFADGVYDVVLGGTIATLPLAASGPLSAGTVRLDPAIGFFGLDVLRADGFLEQAENREALALAIERPALIEPLGVGGWAATARFVPANLPGEEDPAERWPGLSLDERRAVAVARVARWKAANGGSLRLSIALPEGPGAEILYRGLREQLAEVGIALILAEPGTDADLGLRDRVARFAGPRWFLNQFHCSLAPAQCAPEADSLVAASLAARDPAEQARLIAEAEAVLTARNLFIPLGAPIRWSKVRSAVGGFEENAWSFHPLLPLSGAPI
ncbi:ABC transporter substrate-binding protein [Qipengyuania sp.]|uniref:ABC transporter substrate-binding protein n=1 Tax=Qipengyuania sp. TaxID=2004515 RepID=UPI0037352710